MMLELFQHLIKKCTNFRWLFNVKNSSKLFIASSLLVSIGFSMNVMAEESAQIELNDVEIPALIDTVSRITGKTFVVDPRVKGRVTVITGKEVGPDELYELFLSILQVHGFSAVPAGAGSNLIKVIPSNQAKQQPVPVIGEEEEKSTQKSTRKSDELVTRVIRVEHVPAAMLVPILRPLVPSTGQLQAYSPSNTILISDRAANIERLIKVIKRMDRADDEELEVVPLKYASAKDLAATIQKLQQSNVKGARTKNKISADQRTNSLLISGGKSSRQQVRKIIAKLDTEQPLEEKTRVVYLRYANAEDLAQVLTGFSEVQKTTKASTKGAAGTQKAEIDIQADEASNSLIITAEPDVQKNLTKVIARLDVRRAQVLVEAVIAEITSDLSKTLGASLGFSSTSGLLGGSGTVAGVGALLNVLIGGDNATAGLAPPSGGGRLGVADALGSNRFGVLIDALSGDSANNILSTPTVLALDNEEASIVIGQNVPFVTGTTTTTTNGTTNPFQTIERQDVGITLKIKPQINEGDSIRLDIEQEVSSIAASAAGSASDIITNKRSIKTSAMIEDGQVLVLGGLMEDTFSDQITKTPLLGDLPILGNLFRSTTTSKRKQNLMVFIHPVIMRDVLSGDVYTRQKYNKLRGIQSASNVTKRGILADKASEFPADLKSGLTQNLTTEQKQQIITSEQQQRVSQYNDRIKQHKIKQQKMKQQKMERQRQLIKSQAQFSATQLQVPASLRSVISKKPKDILFNNPVKKQK